MTLKEQYYFYRKYVIWFWLILLSGIALFVLFIYLVSIGTFGALPGFEELENPQSNLATQVISSDGELIGRYYKENRTNATFDEIPRI